MSRHLLKLTGKRLPSDSSAPDRIGDLSPAGSHAGGVVGNDQPSSTQHNGVYRWGAPLCRKDKEKFFLDLKQRFDDPEKAFSYIDKVIDRNISKAVGLLQYNAVVLAITYIISYSDYNINIWLRAILSVSILFSIISSLVIIDIMFTHWQKDFRYAWNDVRDSAFLCMKRSMKMTFGLIFSFLASLLDLLFFVTMSINHLS